MSITLSEDSKEEIITTSASIPEDSNEGSLRPKSLADYIGQEKAKPPVPLSKSPEILSPC